MLDEEFLAVSIQGLDGTWWSKGQIIDSWRGPRRDFFMRLPEHIVQISEETYSRLRR